MQDFHTTTLLDALHRQQPQTLRRPVIGITTNYTDGDATLRHTYYQQVVRAGGIPMLIPPVDDVSLIDDTIRHLDGLLLTGGADINPLWQGEQPLPALGTINAQRDTAELAITLRAAECHLPILGICRGIQTMAIAFGGHVAQDIAATATIKHAQQADRTQATHTVSIAKGTTLADIYPTETIAVNSFHHQAVDRIPDHFRLGATAPDGTIEAIEAADGNPWMGVQWHPEWLADDGLPLFQWLTTHAARYAQAKALHRQILTIDSHCDTPMFFPQGIHFGQRDPRILVDLHKMTDGHLDAVTMVAYLPQADATADKAYADNIFDSIQHIVDENSDHVALARDEADLRRNKRQGKKSILLGIENGKALDGQLSNIRHFASRGITYITLCHNGDNDICDSARGTQTWGGLSPFGRDVVREMNRQGLLVDLSHAAETSFYDALQLSATPIVCSHSSCRALCDHPRNLTDEQMKALADRGGVMQITIYNGFLRTDGQATLDDVVSHLNHAVSIMGIDHVGIGTDFDGDGGVPGLNDASALINLTQRLLAEGYTDGEIEKIWGLNWLRVLSQAQAHRQ